MLPIKLGKETVFTLKLYQAANHFIYFWIVVFMQVVYLKEWLAPYIVDIVKVRNDGSFKFNVRADQSCAFEGLSERWYNTQIATCG